jgi:hypothetical protein
MQERFFGFLHTPVGDLRTAKFHRLASKVGNGQIQAKTGCQDESTSRQVRRHVFWWGARFGDGWHDNYPGAKRRWGKEVCQKQVR